MPGEGQPNRRYCTCSNVRRPFAESLGQQRDIHHYLDHYVFNRGGPSHATLNGSMLRGRWVFQGSPYPVEESRGALREKYDG